MDQDLPIPDSLRAAPALRLFDEAELERLATPLSITLERAARARDRGPIPWVVEQMDQECLAIYDAYVSWIGVLQRYILDKEGEAGHALALNWVQEYGVRPFVQRFATLGFRARVERLAMLLRASGSTFHVIEDAQRLRFQLEIWGPARWWREPEGWQAQAPRLREGDRYRYPCYGRYTTAEGNRWLSGPAPLTRGRDRLPAHLALEVQFLEALPIELFGTPLAVLGLGATAAEPVTLDVYKDPAAVPQTVYDALELARPAASDFPAEPTPRVFSALELERLATPLSILVERAAERADWETLLEVTRRMDEELVGAKDPLGVIIAGLLSWIARRHGEAAVEDVLARTAEVVMAPFLQAVRGLDPATAIRLWSMVWRAHGSTFWIEEDAERVVFRGRPLGACGRLWASRYQPEVERISESRVRYPTFGSFQPPSSFHVMREARGITHGRQGYPIYSCHCVMLHEIYPIDQLGHPLWVEQHPLADPDGETVHIHYKDPARWPAHYYTAVGREKPFRE